MAEGEGFDVTPFEPGGGTRLGQLVDVDCESNSELMPPLHPSSGPETDGSANSNCDFDVTVPAREFLAAMQFGQRIPVVPSARFSGFTLDSAYAVETEIRRLRQADGHKVIGRKVGYANKAVWRALKLKTLVWAHMYDDTVHRAGSDSTELKVAHPRSMKVEPEIVFGLKQELVSEELDSAAALAAVDWLAIGFELIDCPFPEWKFQPADFVAAAGFHAALVVGQPLALDPALAGRLVDELSRFKVRMLKNGEFVEEGSGKNSLGNPAACLAELAAAIARRPGTQPLASGEIISSGTLTSGHLTDKGDQWTVEIEGLPISGLTLRLL